MRFSYAESMTDPSFYLPLAQAAEEAGFDSFVVPDSICYPRESDSTYPYTADGNREFLEDKPFIEPFSLIPALGAVTERLRFTTFVVKLPIRHPVLVAKQAASVAVLTGDRLALRRRASARGPRTTPPWASRGSGAASAWTSGSRSSAGSTAGDCFEYHGEFFDMPAVQDLPGADRAAPDPRSAATPTPRCGAPPACGDGWMHAGGDADRAARR